MVVPDRISSVNYNKVILCRTVGENLLGRLGLINSLDLLDSQIFFRDKYTIWVNKSKNLHEQVLIDVTHNM